MKWIPINSAFPIPIGVRVIVDTLQAHHYEAYLVGGCVRDFLLQTDDSLRVPQSSFLASYKIKDYDIATNATPDEVIRLFNNALIRGKAFGVVQVPLEPSDAVKWVEVATFRKDLNYQDSRHPQAVTWASAEEDAERRDFSINALFFDPKRNAILDCVGGLSDLKARIIRAIGDPKSRFQEDALRLLRAIRFKVKFDFVLDSSTQQALQDEGFRLQQISVERIRDELSEMWIGPRPAQALQVLSELGLLKAIFPVFITTTIDIRGIQCLFETWSNHCEDELYVQSAELGWAILLLGLSCKIEDLEKNRKNFLKQFKFSNHHLNHVMILLHTQEQLSQALSMKKSTMQRLLRQDYFKESLFLYKLSSLAQSGDLSIFEFCLSEWEKFKNHQTPDFYKHLLQGEDLIQLGFRQGPEFSDILNKIEDLALEGQLSTKEQAIHFVIKYFHK